MTTRFGPCEPWPVRWPCDVSCESPAATGSAVDAATETIWALSGRQFGFCEVKLRPCRRECIDDNFLNNELLPRIGEDTSFVRPALIAGNWFNIVCGGGCGDNCSCTPLSEVVLPDIVERIVEVRLDGEVMPTGSYRVDNDRLLVRLDGDWPHCQDLNLDDTEPNTWSVTAIYGRDVPEGGRWAVGELACELLKAQKGEDCRLPRNVTQLARQGVTISYPDMNDLFSRGRTGLYLVDLFLSTWNPSGLRNRSRTYSVDRPRFRRTGTAQ